MKVEAVWAGFGMGAHRLARGRRARNRLAVTSVELRGHAAHKSWGAVTALGTTRCRHGRLDGMQLRRRAQTFCRYQFLSIERSHGNQTRRESTPACSAGTIRLGHQNGTHTTFPFGATLLGAGEPIDSQPLQCGGVRGGLAKMPHGTVDGDGRIRVHQGVG